APLSTHRADADVASTCAIFRILLAGVATMPPSLVREIAGLASKDQWCSQVVFEKIAALQEDDAFRAHFAHPGSDVSRETSGVGEENVSRETSDAARRFSLKALRRVRLTKTERAAKVDADDIASDPQREL